MCRYPRLLLAAASTCAFVVAGSAPLSAQAHAVGWRDLAFPNPTAAGSPSLTATVYYCATAPGRDAPLQPRLGGYPVLVFLHGFAALGSFYAPLGEQLAARGYVAVLSNTAQFNAATQVADGNALLAALRVANAQAGGFLHGALDLARVGLAGHSMGGGSTVAVLRSNPGYAAGFCFAPVAQPAAQVAVPLCIVHGSGDTVLPWQAHADAVYRSASGYRGVKALYLLNGDCNHTNVAGLLLLSQTDQDVWARVVRVLLGFLDRYVAGDPAGLEEVIGAAARSEPRLQSLVAEVETPELWQTSRAAIGTTLGLTAAAEPGVAAILLAASSASVPTPFGLLQLDPRTLLTGASGSVGGDRLLLVALRVPNDGSMVGARLPLQSIGVAARAATLRLSELRTVTIVR